MTLPLAAKDARTNMIRAFKASGCRNCGRRYPEVDWSDLHVDHIDPRSKRRPVSPAPSGLYAGGHVNSHNLGGMAAILSELLLCQVLCRECHYRKHRNGTATPSQLHLFTGEGGWRYPGVTT